MIGYGYVGCTNQDGKKMSFRAETLLAFYEMKPGDLDGCNMDLVRCVLYLDWGNSTTPKAVYIQETYEQVAEVMAR